MINTVEVKRQSDEMKYIKAVGTFEEVAEYMLQHDEADLIYFGKDGVDFVCVLFKRC